jgi:hypothetical protein
MKCVISPRWRAVGMALAMLASLFAVLGPAQSASAVAVGDVRVIAYGMNAPGTDTDANRNAEFVRFKNTTGAALDIEGWVLHDTYQTAGGDWGNRYTFKGSVLPTGSPFKVDHDTNPATPDHFVMPIGADVYVYNGSGVDSTPTSNTAAIYRNFRHMWNNAGDTIYIRTAADATGFVARVKFSPYRVDLTQ